ncbi:MAG: hypothetical protein MJB14_15485, partial [Spirochaetes bacterium]|nr:hypothetical protein [Spirochaetota bacterium]
ARKAIIEAGKKVEEASKQPVMNEKGESDIQDPYEFEFDENKEQNLSNAPNDTTSFKDVLNKAIEYVEKAKEAYGNEDYDMAIRYAELAKKIAESYTSTGIKTTYKVRLIPERRDCLWRISEYQYIYGNPFYWPLIWKANKKQVLNPDLVYPGQVFIIPEVD